ncbi:NAD(P)/FAD-dependent oxidoreductase [Foetidibacter luteolus]|uniref:NAD(P)/FAD-dependent oxidoreductase n=1 Tax=Foetidibacter luteolus TaxID=2608880 RepID=UPI00129A7AAA|nr:NAD(P)/FAD-dependent oxidoreductase [Foetidibacter luteolus]
MQQRLTVIGGGAAGFFCAVNAARLNPLLKVTILEKSNKLLSKVKVSGGGRCNTTHACFEIPELVKRYPRGQNFLKKAFHWFNTNDTVTWFKEKGVNLKTEADGRMFPVTDNSQTIIDCLLREANKYQVEILLNSPVEHLQLTGSKWKLSITGREQLETDFLCIASGGFPKLQQFGWLKQTGHTISPPVPSLFTFNMPGNNITELMGISVENATVKIAGTKLSETAPLLITHWGMSGPAILRLSAWGARQLADLNYQFTAIVNWLPAYNENSLREEWIHLRQQLAGQKAGHKNPFGLPVRLWLYLLGQAGIKEETRWADIASAQQNLLIKQLTAKEFKVSGKTTFKEEFVTCGGISLQEIDANIMKSKLQPNLYFAGEIMDVDGITGGFNFQHAWTSGWIAAKDIAAVSLNK